MLQSTDTADADNRIEATLKELQDKWNNEETAGRRYQHF